MDPLIWDITKIHRKSIDKMAQVLNPYYPYSFVSTHYRTNPSCAQEQSLEDLAEEIMKHHSIDPDGNPKETLTRVWVEGYKGYTMFKSGNVYSEPLGIFRRWCEARKKSCPYHATPSTEADLVGKLKKRCEELKADLVLEQAKLSSTASELERLRTKAVNEDAWIDLAFIDRPCLDKECNAKKHANRDAHVAFHRSEIDQITKAWKETKATQAKVRDEITRLTKEIADGEKHLTDHLKMLEGK